MRGVIWIKSTVEGEKMDRTWGRREMRTTFYSVSEGMDWICMSYKQGS